MNDCPECDRLFDIADRSLVRLRRIELLADRWLRDGSAPQQALEIRRAIAEEAS